MKRRPCYAVAVGRKRGIFDTWSECEIQTTRFPGAKHKKCSSTESAERYIEAHNTAKQDAPQQEVSPACTERPSQHGTAHAVVTNTSTPPTCFVIVAGSAAVVGSLCTDLRTRGHNAHHFTDGISASAWLVAQHSEVSMAPSLDPLLASPLAPAIPAPGIHALARSTVWLNAATPTDTSHAATLAVLATHGLTWFSCPLSAVCTDGTWKKTGIFQSGEQNPSASGFYVKCSNITVIDIDGDTAFAREILAIARGRCNLVAETRKGIHLYFSHTPQLRQGYQGKTLKVDIRSWNGKGSPDIVLTPPSEYVADTTVRYKWIATPVEGESLMPCPPEVVSLFATVYATV